MLNQVILIGRMTRDVELKETSNGRIFGIARLAVARTFKNQATNVYETDFVDVSLWGATAENVAKYAGKGSAVSIRGRIVNRILDFPSSQTVRTIGIVGQQVSFIQTKAPGAIDNEADKEENLENDPSEEDIIISDFPSNHSFEAELGEDESEIADAQ